MTAIQHSRGMTMIEAVVASSIFAIVIALSFSVLHFSSKSFTESVQVANLQLRGEASLRLVVDLIADSKKLDSVSVPTGSMDHHFSDYLKNVFSNAEIQFKVPVSNPSQGNLPVNPSALPTKVIGMPGYDSKYTGVDPTFPGDFGSDLIYGWRDDGRNIYSNKRMIPLQGPCIEVDSGIAIPSSITLADTRVLVTGGTTPTVKNSTPSGYMCIRFVMNPNASLGQNGVFSEKDEDVDVDNDGKKESIYAVGYLERSYFVYNKRDGTDLCDEKSTPTFVPDSVSVLADSNILQPIPSPPYHSSDPNSTSPETATSYEDATRMKTNRIFTFDPQNPKVLCINLFLLSMGEARIPRVVHSTSLNFLRNSDR
jgi:hypothetical protein